MHHRISAIFDSRAQAEQALTELRRMGVVDTHLSILSRHEDTGLAGGGGGATAVADDTAERTGKGMLGGAGVGALFGLAAALIPGVGPFIAAGSLATLLGATGGAIAAGALVGATSGAIAGALTKAGYDEREASFYGNEIERGGVMVAVDTHESLVSELDIRSVLTRFGGRVA